LQQWLHRTPPSLLYFDVVIPAPERSHFIPLTVFGFLGYLTRFRAQHLSVLFDALQVGWHPLAAFDRPARASGEHVVHFATVQTNGSGAADACGYAVIKHVRELLLNGEYIGTRESRVKAAHSA